MAPTSTIYCDTCGAANRVQARFCTACGRLLPTAAGASNQTLTGLLVPNHLLKQRYRVAQQIGKGGFGAVYKAEDTQFGNRVVAVKEMSQSGLNTQEITEATNAFKHEALLLAKLSHPNLPHIYEQFHDGGRWYLVMDFIDGETLEEHLLKQGGKLAVAKVLEIGDQLCLVLDYLHNHVPPIIFRDLKPANVMIIPRGQIYLIDFGIARFFKPGQAKDTTAFGSAGYAAPEQYGKMQTTQRADIYSLGATLHQLLTGTDPTDKPFEFAPLRLQATPAFDRLDKLILSMVSMDINKRPESMQVVRQELQAIATLSAAPAQPVAVQPHSLQYGLAPASPPQPVWIGSQSASSSSISRIQPLAPLPANPRGAPSCVCTGHTGRITALAWSPDSQKVASASFDKTIQVWDIASGKSLLVYRNHNGQVFDVAWSPNGRFIASCGQDLSVQVWDAQSGRMIGKYRGHRDRVTKIAWSPDSQRIASASFDKTIQIWEIQNGRTVLTYRGFSDMPLALTWSPDGRHIASNGRDKVIQIWDPVRESRFLSSFLPATRRQLLLAGHTARINALAYAPDGGRIASASSDKNVRTWDANSGTSLSVYSKHSSAVNAVCWSPDGKHIASGGNDKMIHVWDTVTESLAFTYSRHSGYVLAVSWSPDGQHVASGSVDRTVQIWHAP